MTILYIFGFIFVCVKLIFLLMECAGMRSRITKLVLQTHFPSMGVNLGDIWSIQAIIWELFGKSHSPGEGKNVFFFFFEIMNLV